MTSSMISSRAKPERRFKIKDGAQSIGVTMSDIARQLRQGFYGEEALRIQRGKDDVKVQVRYAEKDRRSLYAIEQARIRTPDGRQIPLSEVAETASSRAYSLIRRVDRKRVITVSSDIDEDIGNASTIVTDLKADFLPRLMKRYPGLRYDLEGQEKRTQESLESLKKGFTLALMAIFLLLATQFRSYVQPVIIMMAIPFGLIGAIVGHLVMGLAFTMISIFGIVALSGIVVNDSLILIDFINRAHRNGMTVVEAVMESGRSRFRPVLLTSVTTIAGLFPLLLERSFQAQFLIPMAVSISFGLLAATLLTLLYVPALYLIVDDVVRAVKRRLGVGGIGRCGRQGPGALVNRSTKSRLTVKQLDWFPGDTLFEKIGRAVCRVGTLPGKELFEAWEVARRVRRKFRGGRVVDLACGHGLLAHIMLLLDDTSPEALAVDVHLPENAHRLSEELIESWPRLRQRIRYVQADHRNHRGFIIGSDHVGTRLRYLDRHRAGKSRRSRRPGGGAALLPRPGTLRHRRPGGLAGWTHGRRRYTGGDDCVHRGIR